MNNALRLNCSSCGGKLIVRGATRHRLMTECSRCGANSNGQFQMEQKRKISGVHSIQVSNYRPGRINTK